jgi:Cu(I)/Ag(I) efflux system membrane fusion protein
MARDNAGAYWLQEENIVWNSFYGEAMLRCGEIKQELHAGNAATE